MNNIWEYIFPVSLMGIYCAVVAHRYNRNPALWFVFGFVGNIIGVIFASTFPESERRKSKLKPKLKPLKEDVSESFEIIPKKLNGSLIIAITCLFLWAFLTLIFNALQIFNIYNQTIDLLIIGWNFIICALYIAFGVGLLKLETWAFSWALGSSILNAIISFIYLLNNNYGFEIIITPIQIFIVILLLFNRKMFR